MTMAADAALFANPSFKSAVVCCTTMAGQAVRSEALVLEGREGKRQHPHAGPVFPSSRLEVAQSCGKSHLWGHVGGGW